MGWEVTLVKLVAIVALAVINVVALLHNINSVLTGTICTIIGGIAGYEIGRRGERVRPEHLTALALVIALLSEGRVVPPEVRVGLKALSALLSMTALAVRS